MNTAFILFGKDCIATVVKGRKVHSIVYTIAKVRIYVFNLFVYEYTLLGILAHVLYFSYETLMTWRL